LRTLEHACTCPASAWFSCASFSGLRASTPRFLPHRCSLGPAHRKCQGYSSVCLSPANERPFLGNFRLLGCVLVSGPRPSAHGCGHEYAYCQGHIHGCVRLKFIRWPLLVYDSFGKHLPGFGACDYTFSSCLSSQLCRFRAFSLCIFGDLASPTSPFQQPKSS
jgi:hypothetical protein